jgi:hypothetical protein
MTDELIFSMPLTLSTLFKFDLLCTTAAPTL